MTLEKIAELQSQAAQHESMTREPFQELSASAVKVFHLSHASVATAKAALQDLISPEGKIIEDARSQSIILIDAEERLAQVEPLIAQVIQALDQEATTLKKAEEPQSPPTPELVRRVIRLNYADPDRVKETLTAYLTLRGVIEAFVPAAPGSGGGASARSGSASLGADLGEVVGQGGYIVVVDEALPVSAIEAAAAELDVPIPQVEIQVHIIETNRADGSETGVEWTAIDEDSEASLGVSSSGGQLRFGALKAAEFAAILHALQTQADTRLLASPHITVVENQQAQFHSGEEVPFRRSIIQDGIQEVEVVFKSVGIVLTVMAQVKADNRISLLVSAQVSSLGERPPDGEPPINTRKATTQMLIRDGDTVTIGGLTNERTIESISRVPILGSIPLLGGFFRSREYTKSLNEITIYLTPTIVRLER
jgi:type II secretory pathway component GspD/PulD (secretin)